MKKLLLITGACFVLAVFAGSCSTGDETAMENLMKGRSILVPLFLGGKAVNEDEFEFDFSHAVKINSINFVLNGNLPGIELKPEINSIENGKTVKVRLKEKLPPGILLTVDLLAEDEQKNTINVIIPVRSRNNRMPKMVINEVRTENTKPKCEFIEFVMKSPGNLGGMRVFIFGNSNGAKQTIYEFSPVEVKQGEYVVLNLRTPEAECKNEYGANLAESGGTNASASSRDFWMPGSTKYIHKTSIVYVLDQDDNVLASVMMSETPDEKWGRTELKDAAEFLFNKGVWKSPDGKICTPEHAVISAGATNTRTVSRDESKENTNTAQDWYITGSSGNSPGKPNSTSRYNP